MDLCLKICAVKEIIKADYCKLLSHKAFMRITKSNRKRTFFSIWSDSIKVWMDDRFASVSLAVDTRMNLYDIHPFLCFDQIWEQVLFISFIHIIPKAYIAARQTHST